MGSIDNTLRETTRGDRLFARASLPGLSAAGRAGLRCKWLSPAGQLALRLDARACKSRRPLREGWSGRRGPDEADCV
eukprot:scaffold2003_cov420-Prasinococcus_capsulatus_cf.AAC.1